LGSAISSADSLDLKCRPRLPVSSAEVIRDGAGVGECVRCAGLRRVARLWAGGAAVPLVQIADFWLQSRWRVPKSQVAQDALDHQGLLD